MSLSLSPPLSLSLTGGARIFAQLANEKHKLIDILSSLQVTENVFHKIDSMICVRSFVEAICKTTNSTTSEHNNMSVSGKRVAGDGGGGGGGSGIDPSFALWPVVLLEDSISNAFTSAIRHLTHSWQRGQYSENASATVTECSLSCHSCSCHVSSCHTDSGSISSSVECAKHSLLSRSQSSTNSVMSSTLANTVTPVQSSSSSSSSLMSGKCSTLPEYSLKQVAEHSTPRDCWLVIYDKIYDITHFLQEHPGGEFILLEFAGRDATLAFRGTRHGPESYELLKKYLIGILPQSERIYEKRKTSVNMMIASLDTEPNPSC